MPRNTFVLPYRSLVRPHPEYANAVWSPYKKGEIEDSEKTYKTATKLNYIHFNRWSLWSSVSSVVSKRTEVAED